MFIEEYPVQKFIGSDEGKTIKTLGRFLKDPNHYEYPKGPGLQILDEQEIIGKLSPDPDGGTTYYIISNQQYYPLKEPFQYKLVKSGGRRKHRRGTKKVRRTRRHSRR